MVTPTGGMGVQAQRGRANSTCSEEGTEATQEADYDGDGEDSIHYSSTENLHHAVRRNTRLREESSLAFHLTKSVWHNSWLRLSVRLFFIMA